tara:strand:+ start:459 stop:620 length:162 start_codon:yes stop_codon:yes gene_type:complete
MSKIYKIWVHIEEIDEDDGLVEEVGEPECLGEFETLDEAIEVMADLAHAEVCK